MNVSRFGYWKLKAIEDYTHEELCQIVCELAGMVEGQREQYAKDLDTLGGTKP